jgi:hypothetical protein
MARIALLLCSILKVRTGSWKDLAQDFEFVTQYTEAVDVVPFGLTFFEKKGRRRHVTKNGGNDDPTNVGGRASSTTSLYDVTNESKIRQRFPYETRVAKNSQESSRTNKNSSGGKSDNSSHTNQ